jgi:lipid-A-disaccharide synthase
MQEAGVDLVCETVGFSSVGLVESIRFIRQTTQVLQRLKSVIQEVRPRAIVLVDAQGLNIRLAHFAKRLAIPTIFYFSPQIWLWGFKWQARRLPNLITHFLAVFKNEEFAYRKIGANVTFIGHPFLDTVPHCVSDEEVSRRQRETFNGGPIIGILPGSRFHEITRHTPLLRGVIERISAKERGVQFLLPVPSPIFKPMILQGISGLPVNVVEEKRYDYMASCDLLITASGTVTIEASILGVPMVIFYKTSRSTYLLGKLLSHHPFIGMPNILLGRELCPEFVQHSATPDRIAEEALQILRDDSRRRKMKDGLRTVTEALGSRGALQRAAKVILNYLTEGRGTI